MSHWLVPLRERRPDARIVLYLLAYAGGSARALTQLAGCLPAWVTPVGVELPGHGHRIREPPTHDLAALAQQVCATLPARPDEPYALFGHSMGALLAFELARCIERADRPPPRVVCVSGRAGPATPLPRVLHRLDDERFWAAICAYGGTPPEAALSPELRRLFLPILRADITACETYAPGEPAHVRCPLRALWGVDDRTAHLDHVLAWQRHTTGAFALSTFSGGHFFLHERAPAVADAIAAALEAHALEVD